MAKAFNLTAELNLRGPSNLKQLAASIRRELGTIDANVNVKIDKGAERSITASSAALNRLNRELQTTSTAAASSANNITNLVSALNGLSSALSGSNNSMQRIVSTSEQTVQQMSRIRKNTVAARDEMEEFGRQSALAVRRFAAFNFATSVIYGFYNAVSKALGEFVEFDRQLVRLTQITGESYTELSRITETITGLSSGLGVASSDLIRISDTLAQAGLSARETDQALKALALTALAPSFDDLNNTVEGSIALMRQFKIGTDQLAGALGSINAVAAGFAVEASDIITAIQRTGGVFAAASKGVSEGTDALNEFVAVFTSVRATTRESAETIATGLRTIFTRIQREDTIQALKEYGVNLLDVEGKFVGAYRAVQLLSEGLGKLDPRDVSFSRIVEELGGFRQIGKVLPLIQEFGTAQQALAVAQRGQGSLAADAAKAQSALSVQFTKTRESFVALIRDIGNSDSFKTLISLGLTLANTFIKVADFAKPLLPILTTIAAIKGAKALTSFVGGFAGGLSKTRSGRGGGAEDAAAEARTNNAAASITDNSRYLDANTTALNNLGGSLNNLTAAISPLQASIDNLGNAAISQLTNEIMGLNNALSSFNLGGGPPAGGPTLNSGGIVRKFAKGGSVPGSGNTDSVPALLTPGEFVVNKKAARAVGSKNLHRINAYASGGAIRAGIADIQIKEVEDGDTFTAQVTPNAESFSAKFRMGSYDAYETGNRRSRITANKLDQIRKYNTRSGALTEIDETSDPIAIPSYTRVKKGTTASEAGEEGKKILTSTLSSIPKETMISKINSTLDTEGGFGRYLADLGQLLPDELTTGRTWKNDTKNLGGLIQKFQAGGVVQRKIGYIDYDVISNPANEDIVKKGMEETGITGPRLYADHLTQLAVKARKKSNIEKLRAIYGVAGSGKTTLARGQGTDKGTLRETTRFPILSPDDIKNATEILVLSSSVSKDKLDELFTEADRTYTLSSTTKEEKARVRSQRAGRDVTGVGLEGRQPGVTSSAATDTAVGEALLSDRLGDRSVVLGRSESGRLRRKRGDELVEVIKRKIGFTWGGFAPMTAGHESIMDAAAAMGISPEDFIYLVGSNEGIKAGDPSSYRTAIFDQDFRMILAKAGAGAKGATVLPKPRDFEVPQAFDISEEGADRRKVLVPEKGSRAFVADKTAEQTQKYKDAGYAVTNLERMGGISGTMVRDLIMSGDMGKLQEVLSPGVYDIISNNIGRLQNRANALPSIIEQVKSNQGVQLADIERQIKAVGISRIDAKKVESDPEYAAKAEVLQELRSKRDKIKSAASFEPYRLLDELARSQPDKYGLDLSTAPIAGTEVKPIRTVQAAKTQQANMGGLIRSFAGGGSVKVSLPNQPISLQDLDNGNDMTESARGALKGFMFERDFVRSYGQKAKPGPNFPDVTDPNIVQSIAGNVYPNAEALELKYEDNQNTRAKYLSSLRESGKTEDQIPMAVRANLGGLIQRFIDGEEVSKELDPAVISEARKYGKLEKLIIEKVRKSEQPLELMDAIKQTIIEQLAALNGASGVANLTSVPQAIKSRLRKDMIERGQIDLVQASDYISKAMDAKGVEDAAEAQRLEEYKAKAISIGIAGLSPLDYKPKEFEWTNIDKKGTDIYAIARVFDAQYMQAAINMQRKLAGVAYESAAEFQDLGIFGGGESLALDFDDTLVSGAEILGSNGKPDVPKYTQLDLVAESLKKGRLTRLGSKLKTLLAQNPNFIKQTRILTARPSSNIPLVADTLKSLGLPFSESMITGVGGPGVSDVSKAKAQNLSATEKLIDDNIDNVMAAKKAGKKSFQYSELKQGSTELDELMGQGNLEGAATEKALAILGAPIKPDAKANRAIDYPMGLGPAAQFFSGLPSNIPTEVKRTIDGSSLEKAREEIRRYLTEGENAEKPQEKSLGGIIQKFANGGLSGSQRGGTVPMDTSDLSRNVKKAGEGRWSGGNIPFSREELNSLAQSYRISPEELLDRIEVGPSGTMRLGPKPQLKNKQENKIDEKQSVMSDLLFRNNSITQKEKPISDLLFRNDVIKTDSTKGIQLLADGGKVRKPGEEERYYLDNGKYLTVDQARYMQRLEDDMNNNIKERNRLSDKLNDRLGKSDSKKIKRSSKQSPESKINMGEGLPELDTDKAQAINEYLTGTFKISDRNFNRNFEKILYDFEKRGIELDAKVDPIVQEQEKNKLLALRLEAIKIKAAMEDIKEKKLNEKEEKRTRKNDALREKWRIQPSLLDINNKQRQIPEFAIGGKVQSPPPPPAAPDKSKQKSSIPKDMEPIAKAWPVGYKIASGDWVPQGSKSIGVGQFAGDMKETTDFGGSGWKMRLDPKKDNDNIIIADWFAKNKKALSAYKIAINTDKPIWTAYTEKGSLPEIQNAAKKAESDLGKFIKLNEVYDSPDTIIPGTSISGRFEIRGDERSGTPRAKDLVKTITERRKATSKYRDLYSLYKQSPGFSEGFPSSTSGSAGVPGTNYYQWLLAQKKLAEKGKNPDNIRKYSSAASEEIELIRSILKEKVPEYSGPAKKQDIKTQMLAAGGKVKLYHGSTTGIDDAQLKSFKEKGAQSDIAKGYGQGAGFYVFSDLITAIIQAEGRAAGRFTAGGDTTGKKMTLTFEEVLDPKTWDLDYEMSKGPIIKWISDNYDSLKDKIAPGENIAGITGVTKFDPKAAKETGLKYGLASIDTRSSTGDTNTIHADSGGDIREGEILGQIMNRLQANDPATVYSFEEGIFGQQPLPKGLALKYTGSTPLTPTDITTFARGGNVSKFADGGTVPALLTPGEAVIGPKLAKQIGYGRLRKMNHAEKNGMGRYANGGDVSIVPGSGNSDTFGPVPLPVGSFVIRKKATKALGFNKGGSVGISGVQRFEMGGEVLTPKETAQLNAAMSTALESLPKELQAAVRNVKLPEIDMSSWDQIALSLSRRIRAAGKDIDTLGKDVVEAIRFISTQGMNELQDIDLGRVRAQQAEVATRRGDTPEDIDKMREDVSTARQARGAVMDRRRKNTERVAQGRAPFPEMGLMETMNAAVGRPPAPISVEASVPQAPTEKQRTVDDYVNRMNYSDVAPQRAGTPISDRGMQYAEELTKQDSSKVDALVQQMRDMFASAMSGIGQAPSAAGQSESWATWDIGKQLFMNQNPDQSSDKYRLGNPMQDPKLVLEMVQRMVGFEVTGGGQREGKANNIPSFELVEIGAKAMAESLGKNQAALDAFLNLVSGITAQDIIGTGPTAPAPSAPTPPTPPTAPGSPPVPPTPPGSPPGGPPTPPTPPGSPPAGDTEAMIQRYMMELEAAAKATKLQTYQAQRLAGATASEAKARADAAAFAAYQALAQQRLTTATTEEAAAINEARSRMAGTRGGAGVTPAEFKPVAETLSRGGSRSPTGIPTPAPAPDTTDYRRVAQNNIAALNKMSVDGLKWAAGLVLSTQSIRGLIGTTTTFGKVIDGVSNSVTKTQALFTAFNEAVSLLSKAGASETFGKILEGFSSKLIDAGRTVNDWASKLPDGFLKNIASKIGGGVDLGGGVIGKLGANLPKVISNVTSSLISILPTAQYVVTGLNAAAEAFIQYTDAIRQDKIDKATTSLESSLKNASSALDSYNKNTIDNASQLSLASAEINRAGAAAKALADIDKTNQKWSTTNIIGETLAMGGGGSESRAQRAEILDKKGMGAYIGSLLDVTGSTQKRYSEELAPQQAVKSSEQFARVASLIQQQNQARFKAGESSSDIMNSPEWAQQAEIIARSNAATEERLRLIDADISLSKSAREARKQELIQFAASGSVRDQEIQAIRQANSDRANQESNSLLYGLERMLSNMEQSVNSVTYSLSKLADQTDLLRSSMTGEAKIGSSRVDAINVLQNPNVSSDVDRAQASKTASQFFGSQGKDIEGLLNFGPKLEETVLSTINRTIKEDPNAGSGKIEARITQNLEKELGKLNLDAGLKQSVSKQTAAAITESRTKGDDKTDFKSLFSETASFGKVVQATKRAQEAAVKALEFYQQSVNNYAQSMNEMVSLQISANEKFRRASDIRSRGEMDLSKALGKTVSFETSKQAARSGVISQAGTADPTAIFNNIGRLEQIRQGQQSSLNSAVQGGPRNQKDIIAFNRELASTTMSLRENYSALKGLAESTEVAQAAMTKIGELKAKNEAGANILERFVTSSPKDQAKLSGAFDRLERNMNGQTNNMWDSVRVQEAYNEALQSGASMQEAQDAADSAAAQDRGDTLEAFKMLAPMLGENQGELKANMLESMMRESGVETSPMFAKVLEGLRNPEGDPQMAEAINQYRQATELQAIANQHLAALDGRLAVDIGQQSQAAFTNALNGVGQAFANTNSTDISKGINELNNHLRSGVTKVSDVGGGGALPFARGGVVEYRAIGGSIFKPKGTDTVPAMLTPGEFVVNKQAASANKGLLTAINNGYSKGGSVKYLAEGGWVSDMLVPEKDRFGEAKPGELYTKWDDFSKFGSGDDTKAVQSNIQKLLSDSKDIYFYQPYSFPTFGQTEDSNLLNQLRSGLDAKESIFGIFPDFSMSLMNTAASITGATATGVGQGALGGAAMAANPAQFVSASLAGNMSQGKNTAGALLGDGALGTAAGWIWEAMKFVPGLGAVISGIDAFKKFVFDYDILGGVLEAINAVFSLIPFPGAGLLGKGVSKGLGWMLRTLGPTRVGRFGKTWIPRLIEAVGAGKLMGRVKTWLGQGPANLVENLLPDVVKKKLGLNFGKTTATLAQEGVEKMSPEVLDAYKAYRQAGMAADEALAKAKGRLNYVGSSTSGMQATAAQAAARNAVDDAAINATRSGINDMAARAATGSVYGAGAMGTVGAVSAYMQGRTPSAASGGSVAEKLQNITKSAGFRIPDKFTTPDTTTNLLDNNLDNLSLSEAKMQLDAVSMWAKALDEASQWNEVSKAPQAKATYDGSTYRFTSDPAKDKDYMYATIGEALNIDKIPAVDPARADLIKFYKDGSPTLSSNPDQNKLSQAASSFIGSQARDFKALIDNTATGNRFKDIETIKAHIQDYYDSLKEINTDTTTAKDFNPAHWSASQPSKQKESKISAILGSLQAGTRYSYEFKRSDLATGTNNFQWGSTEPPKVKDGEKPAEIKDTGDMLTVYGTEMRAIWSTIKDAEDETIKEAIKNKNIWDGKAENSFKIYRQGAAATQYDPLPWTTNPSLITEGMRQAAQQATEDNIATTIGLKMGTVSSYDKVIDLPKAKRELPVTFAYQPFEQIPLLDPATVDIEGAVNQFLPAGGSAEPSPTPAPGVFIKYRSADSPALNPFASMAPGADKLMPYYSSVANMEKAVNEWALSNFDTMTDWSLLGVSLAAGYSPIKAEAAMKAAESIRGARTKRKSKEGSVPTKDSPVNSATEYLYKKDALFYQDDFLSAVAPEYPEAANIIGAKIPKLVDIMQRRAVRQISANKDAKKAEISAKAALVNFKSDEIPLLGDIVWQKVKESSLSAGPSLSSASDWQKAATDDGVPPPTNITGQDDLLAAVDYIAWIQAKVLRLRDKAVEKGNKESVENLQSEAEFGKYMSAGRFLSQLASDSERPVSSSTTIGQASERLYSKYMNENKLDKYIKKSGFKDKDSGKEIEQQFWDIPKIINEDKSFVDYILGFANQTRTAQRFKQAVTGNGRAELGSEQKALLQGQFKAFGQAQTATAMMGAEATKQAAQTTMKVASADGITEVSIPQEINDVIEQFLDTSKVYEPLYRETLGKILETNGRTYADKWEKSGDPGSAGWSGIWDEYSAQLASLTEFLVNRDRLLMRPIAEEGSSLFPMAVLPAISGSLLPTLQEVAKVSGIMPPADVTAETLLAAIGDRAMMMEQIKKFMASVSPTAPEDYEKRDQMKKIAKQAMDFYENNLSPSALPRVFTQEGNEIWEKMKATYNDANMAYMGFGADGSDVSTGLGAIEDIYNPSQMPYAQNTLYGLYYRLNKQAGTNNTVDALINEKAAKDKAASAAATPKPESKVEDVPAQAAAAAPKEPEPGLPPEPSKQKVEEIAAQNRARGGIIYRVAGGPAPVNWTPRGTDTVPAMLTPGEFVINRGATQKYLPILEAINSGNVSHGAITAAVQSGATPATSYASRGGVIQPKYFQVGGNVEGGSGGVSTSYTMGFDSATLAAIKQFDTSVQALGDALAGLQLGNIRIDEAALSALGDFATRFDQFTQSLLKLNVPPVISITGQHEVNVNINGASVISNMEEKMQQFISQEVSKAFTQLSKETEGNITMNWKPPTSPMG